jgi:hypothetical protein
MRVVDFVIERFPGKASAVRRLYLRDQNFRAICDDLALCTASLQAFEARKDGRRTKEIHEYRALQHELETELRSLLAPEDN